MPKHEDSYMRTDEDEYEDEQYEFSDTDPADMSDDAGGEENADEDEPSPGETIMWFGAHIGKKFDDLPQSYVLWLIDEYEKEDPERRSLNLIQFKALYDEQQAWAEKRIQLPPGQTPLWFGQFEGTLFQDLEDWYYHSIMNQWHKDPVTCAPNIRKFKEVSDRYNAWLEAKHGRKKSPGSIYIWFGEDKGQEFRKLYVGQPKKWKWFMKPGNCRWRLRLAAIAREYEDYLAQHRRKPPVYRSKPNIVNPVGRKLGRADDEPASDTNDSYLSDGGFAVKDDGAEARDDDLEEDNDHNMTEENEGKETLPDLDGVPLRTPKSAGRRLVPRSSLKSAAATEEVGSGDESEEPASPSRHRSARKTAGKAKVVMNESESEEGEEEITPPSKHRSSRRSVRITTPVTDDTYSEDADEEDEIGSIRILRSTRRTTQTKGTCADIDMTDVPNTANDESSSEAHTASPLTRKALSSFMRERNKHKHRRKKNCKERKDADSTSSGEILTRPARIEKRKKKSIPKKGGRLNKYVL